MQPYQVLFPMGFVYALVGVLFWGLYALGLMAFPAFVHAQFMVPGFLFTFIAGFFMTAAPKFMGSYSARRIEIVIAGILSGFIFFIWAFNLAPVYYFIRSALLFLFLFYFYVSRYRKKRHDPPPYFRLLPFGFILGFFSAGALILHALHPQEWIKPDVLKNYLYQDVVFILILGVGSRLIAALLGWFNPQVVQMMRNINQKQRNAEVIEYKVVFIFFLFSLVLDWYKFDFQAALLRALIVTFVGMTDWKLHRLPKNRGRLPNWLYIFACCFLVASWVPVFTLKFGVHGLHLLFAGGFGAITILIASRIILAHGGYGLDLEYSSKALLTTGLLILLATVTRLTAPLLPASYVHHLGYAAVVWVSALLVWGVVFIPRIFGMVKT